ncbi:F-box/RNI-like superfamily protein [Rhynchospora pubera]|uniref:F-box/RNI-like superfamily protein n=1 Tax=Rhynchospora pubera TaxID=906938 RepID=A0AAV8EU86_9POAL|nr:F-box/RNI-like superfamily protein [Rhynchospora pubera]KAJ4776891.1 F-box/RNI-like superfamily protein [Rhynchospora pubera]KAJ4783685.1 F-box/RNI-like superfamily protein [Rhynchospora pubera]
MNNSDEHRTMSDDDPDRMSTLPDDLLLHILSFLGTKEAVQMSFVSKRWMYLWTIMPCLNFDIEQFGVASNNIQDCEQIHSKFIKFVKMVLSRHKSSSLNTFQIRCRRMLDFDSCYDLGWTLFHYPLMSNARVVSIEALIPNSLTVARIFSSQSIEAMCLKVSTKKENLYNSHSKVIPEVVNLPCIRTLQLQRLTVPTKLDERSITNLLSGCPVLEELSLKYCVGEFSSIFSQKLKYLCLRDCLMKLPLGRTVKWELYRAMIKQNVQRSTVKSRFFLDGVTVEFVWSTMEGALVDGTLSFIQDFIQHLNYNDFLCGLSGVRILKLFGGNLKGVLEIVLPKLGEFYNLRNLFLTGLCTPCNFNLVASFLQKSPNLQKLTFYDCGRHFQKTDPETYYRSFRVKLSDATSSSRLRSYLQHIILKSVNLKRHTSKKVKIRKY